jgi:hypothetical protein
MADPVRDQPAPDAFASQKRFGIDERVSNCEEDSVDGSPIASRDRVQALVAHALVANNHSSDTPGRCSLQSALVVR